MGILDDRGQPERVRVGYVSRIGSDLSRKIKWSHLPGTQEQLIVSPADDPDPEASAAEVGQEGDTT